MSPALTDTGDLYLHKGQIFNTRSSYNLSKQQKIFCGVPMDHNLGHTGQGQDPNPSPFGSSAKLQKPRLYKKKYMGPHKKDQPFNPFKGFVENQEMDMGLGVGGNLGYWGSGDVGNKGFVFGASRISGSNDQGGLFGANSNTNVGEGTFLVDEMRKLKLESEKKMNVSGVNNNVVNSVADKGGSFVFTGGDAKLDEMVSKEVESKLKIDSEGNVDSARNVKPEVNVFGSLSSSENVDNKFGGGVGVNLSNEMNKLNIKESIENDVKDYAYMERGSLGGSSETLLHDKMKNMHINEPIGSYVANENVKVDPSSSDPSGNIVNKHDNVNESGVGSRSRSQFGQTQTDFPASADNVNKGKTEFSGNTDAGGISDSIPSGFSFQAAMRNSPFSNPVEFSFTTKSDGLLMQNFGFKTPTVKGSLNKKVETRREATKDPRYKKKKGKPKQTHSTPVDFAQDFAFRGSSEENAEPSEPYSPMDISPYREAPADNTLSRETSLASDESFSLNETYGCSDSRPADANDVTDEDLVDATERMNINENDVTYNETQEVKSGHSVHHGADTGGPFEESISGTGTETESFKSATEHLDYSTDSFVTAADNEVTSKSTIERQDSDGGSQFSVTSNFEEGCIEGNFIFGASSVAQNQIAAATRQQKKKNRTKLTNDSCSSMSTTQFSYSSSPVQFLQVSGSSLSSPTQGKKGYIPALTSHSQGNDEPAKVQKVNHETVAASMAAQEACEKWRLRGNQAYANGNLSKAEESYTQGLNCVSGSETSKSCLRALMLCYSNRAATRMSLGRMREALEDCTKAVALDPNFFRVQVRAANCYLALGEVENASKFFMKCLQQGPEVCADRKILVEASEGLEKTQRVSECMKQCVELLQRRRQSDADLALGAISEALTISTYSEKLLEMKADALLLLRRYEEVIQLCEKTLEFAKSNALPSNSSYQSSKLDSAATEKSASSGIWCFSKIVKSYFYLGKLEEADTFMKNQEKSMCLMESSGLKNLEAVVPLAVIIRELLCLKAAGNAAFQSGKHAEAVEHYTAAVSCNFESRPFTAICFCNRAAAYRAMGQISDAIADCSLAIALDGNYVKALSRRASLFEMIRDYGRAASDLQRLVSLLTRHMENKVGGSGSHNKMSFINEIRQTQRKLSVMEEEARKEIPLNFYLILGVDSSAGASEIRKAYRKAALKHHPDKAGQSLARNDNADDGLWKDIAEEVHRDADRLFKMIGEAYAVLSDSAKRSRYDLEEEMRNSQSRGNESSTFREHTDFNNYPSERSGSRHNWEDVWRAYKSTQPRESDRNRSNW
ncbi:uncharacterized protein LOC107786894 [Nicotiana tabacum]|uniref:Uncharacterized protein LOC107786894 n=1 Tax=Nicotiana tabacum TaxID=4097 RepID=A0A1S3ZHH1_TOBAC|nr:PREDICTED: uncharacterized protein LOC107786894 [Nicotiana tabacum]